MDIELKWQKQDCKDMAFALIHWANFHPKWNYTIKIIPD